MSPAKRSDEGTHRLRAELLDHARELIARDGAAALTMRALATEAGCAVGLPYKVFADRTEIVRLIVVHELSELGQSFAHLDDLVGVATVGANLAWLATRLLTSPALPLASELHADPTLWQTTLAEAHTDGIGPAALPSLITRYLTAEQRIGRLPVRVDTHAVGYVIASAIHNLLVAGAGWPRPTTDELVHILGAAAGATDATTSVDEGVGP